jgi:ubiquinone/menaquinone biosynthesis C-methylase UbiE
VSGKSSAGPSPEDYAEIVGFFDRAAETWDDYPGPDPLTVGRFLAQAAISPGDTVLDVGCGTGSLFPFILDRVGAQGRVIGLDVAPAMLERAEIKGGDRVTCLRAPVEAIPLPDRSCQAVLCYSAFPHFPDQALAVAEMGRVLSPGGRVVIAHGESREAINRFHAQRGGAVAGHILPDDVTMRGFLAAAALDELLLYDGSDGYLLVGRKPVDPRA